MEDIKIGMVGGGLTSVMGAVHRRAIEKAGGIRLTCGAFSSSRLTSFKCQKPFGLEPRGACGGYRELLRRMARLPKEKRVAFVTTVLPNSMHYPVAMMAMDCGMPILSEKPFTCNMDEATNLARKSKAMGVPYRIAMVYRAYPMLDKARSLFMDGALGRARGFRMSMQQGWMAGRVELDGNRPALWRTEARTNGAGGVVNGTSCCCQFVLEHVTGYGISEVCANARPSVPGRLVADEATVMLRTAQGIDGVFLLSRIAVGHREGLSMEIVGDSRSMRWSESRPGRLALVDASGKEEEFVDDTAPVELGAADAPFVAGEAHVDALAKVYRDFADFLAGGDTSAGAVGMTIEEGVRTVAVSEAIVKNAAPPAEDQPPPPKWTPVDYAGYEMTN